MAMPRTKKMSVSSLKPLFSTVVGVEVVLAAMIDVVVVSCLDVDVVRGTVSMYVAVGVGVGLRELGAV